MNILRSALRASFLRCFAPLAGRLAVDAMNIVSSGEVITFIGKQLMATFTIKASDFIYPSRKERKEISKGYPKISIFNFPYVNEFESLIESRKNPEIVHKENNLYWWNNCLQNKLGSLYQSYINTLTHYNRGVPDGRIVKYEASNIPTLLQFNFYSEIFYYFFFSACEITGQIVSIYYDLPLTEKEVSLNKVCKKIEDRGVKDILTEFMEKNERASEFRNAFTHRFPKNRPDYRTKMEETDGKKMLHFFNKPEVLPRDIIENIKASLNNLSVLLESLQVKMQIDLEIRLP